jgi:hypothetical protein
MSPRRNWESPTPSLASECAPPPRSGGRAHSPAGDVLGESQFRRLEKKLRSLPYYVLFSAFAQSEKNYIVSTQRCTECSGYICLQCKHVQTAFSREGKVFLPFHHIREPVLQTLNLFLTCVP